MSADPALGTFVRELVVEKVIDETHDARSIAFCPPDDRRHFDSAPGQFLTLRIPSAQAGSVARSYSLSSSPHTDDRLVVTVKRTRDGYGSNWLATTSDPACDCTSSLPREPSYRVTSTATCCCVPPAQG